MEKRYDTRRKRCDEMRKRVELARHRKGPATAGAERRQGDAGRRAEGPSPGTVPGAACSRTVYAVPAKAPVKNHGIHVDLSD